MSWQEARRPGGGGGWAACVAEGLPPVLPRRLSPCATRASLGKVRWRVALRSRQTHHMRANLFCKQGSTGRSASKATTPTADPPRRLA